MTDDNPIELPALTPSTFKADQIKDNQGGDQKKNVLSTIQTEKSNQTVKTHPSKKMTSSKLNLISECIQMYNVHGTSIFKLNPQLQQHQAIDYKIPSFEVQVTLDDIKQEPVLWDVILGYAKRQLFIHDGFVYSLEKNNTGHFVDSVWCLNNLFQVYYDLEDKKFRLVFLQGKGIKNRDFWTKNKQAFITRLKEELQKMGKRLM